MITYLEDSLEIAPKRLKTETVQNDDKLSTSRQSLDERTFSTSIVMEPNWARFPIVVFLNLKVIARAVSVSKLIELN